MLNAFRSFSPAYQLILKDKVSLLLALIPILIGLALYIFVGQAYFSTLIEYGQSYIEKNLSDGTFGQVLYYLVVAVLTVALYFIVNWTFVLVLSIIASPFNDLLSSRIEKVYLGKELPSLGESFQGMFQEVIHTVFNEVKKMTLILVLSLLAFVIGYIPLLTPISIFITVILLAAGYVDYSWSRHNMPFKECRSDISGNIFSYGIGGFFFMIIVSIPIINIIVPSLATSYFTILWVKNNEHRRKITE